MLRFEPDPNCVINVCVVDLFMSNLRSAFKSDCIGKKKKKYQCFKRSPKNPFPVTLCQLCQTFASSMRFIPLRRAFSRMIPVCVCAYAIHTELSGKGVIFYHSLRSSGLYIPVSHAAKHRIYYSPSDQHSSARRSRWTYTQTHKKSFSVTYPNQSSVPPPLLTAPLGHSKLSNLSSVLFVWQLTAV